MNGPCMCGDPACPRCGNLAAAVAEAAGEWLLDELAKHHVSAIEYLIVARVGIAAVEEVRKAVQQDRVDQAADRICEGEDV